MLLRMEVVPEIFLLYKTWSGSLETSEQTDTFCFNPVSIPLAAEARHSFSIFYKSVFLVTSKGLILSQSTT